MADLDDVTEGISEAWDDARRFRIAQRDKTDLKGLVAPEAFLGRDMGALDKPGNRAKFAGKRIGSEKFLAMEAHCKALGITPDYGTV